MNNMTPIIPIRLPMNSTVSLTSPTSGAQKIAIKKPVIIIGIPIQTVICLDVMYQLLVKLYMKFMMRCKLIFQFLSTSL